MNLRALYLLALVATTACGDDSGTQADAAPPVDARLLFDATRQSCTPDGDSCATLNFKKVCDPERSYCVECLTSSDCQGLEALGPSCSVSDKSCRCASADDCEDNIGGSYCHPIASACGCLFDEDCPQGSTCEIEPYLGTGIRRCRAR